MGWLAFMFFVTFAHAPCTRGVARSVVLIVHASNNFLFIFKKKFMPFSNIMSTFPLIKLKERISTTVLYGNYDSDTNTHS